MTASKLAEQNALLEGNRRLRNVYAQLSLDRAGTKEMAKEKW